MDKDCKYNPAQQRQKIFTNKCLKPGCKRKEMMKVVCEQCGGNFCIKHRHPLDHECKGSSHPISKAGYAALMRASQTAFKSMGAMGVPSNGSLQHNRIVLVYNVKNECGKKRKEGRKKKKAKALCGPKGRDGIRN
ncbi:AN1-type zinc finger protein 2A isoform X6 [Strigops habroptila]|nr:AN1-type zinc finger protein 2A isoform X6 [Strigops habroptila]